MKIKKANHIHFLTISYLSLVTGDIYFHLPYRQTKGFIKATVGMNLPGHPSYSQICIRVNKLDIPSKRLDDDDGWHNHSNRQVQGIKVTNRGQVDAREMMKLKRRKAI